MQSLKAFYQRFDVIMNIITQSKLHFSEAARGKKLFLKILQYSQESTCVGVSNLIILRAWGLQLY